MKKVPHELTIGRCGAQETKISVFNYTNLDDDEGDDDDKDDNDDNEENNAGDETDLVTVRKVIKTNDQLRGK